MSTTVIRAFDGCYDAKRAAALSGVPLSTVYYWAKTKVVEPSISVERPKLWSYADLMGSRIVSWLRHPKEGARLDLPPSPMGEVRKALRQIQEAGLDLWQPGQPHEAASPLRVDRQGRIYISDIDGLTETGGQGVLEHEALDLLGVFTIDGTRGPDLRRPRAHLRIVPGKVAGEPHVEGTRITTVTLAALRRRGYPLEVIAELYPSLEPACIAEALDLEDQLAGHLAAA